jgi:oligopeptide transport system permease protein
MLGDIKNKEDLEDLELESRSLFQDATRRFFQNKAAVVSLVMIGMVVLLILFGQNFSQYSYEYIDWDYMQTAPNFQNGHYFGTDELGRDMFARTMQGGKISLMVGLAGAFVAIIVGVLYGATSGFIGGTTDGFMMRFVDILASFPFMFFVILLVTFFGQNIGFIFIAIGMVSWLDIARIVRGQTLSLKEKEFIEAARVSGASDLKIVLKHIIPNVVGIVVVYATLLIPDMIIFESFLSFLGLGVQEPDTSWGALVNEGSKVMDMAIWQLAFPGFLLVLTLFCFNFLGDGLRDALDPKDR